MLNYNNTDPEHIKERQNVVPPTVEQVSLIVNDLERITDTSQLTGAALDYANSIKKRIQILLNHYQNLQHFHDVVGGWEGYNNKRQEAYEEGYEDGKNEHY